MVIIYLIGLIIGLCSLIIIVRKIYLTRTINTDMNTKNNNHKYKVVNNDIKEYLLMTV